MGVVTPLEYANEPIQRALGGRGLPLILNYKLLFMMTAGGQYH